ncbi:MAG: J domain-containing protein [Acidimicrobiales bacterium]
MIDLALAPFEVLGVSPNASHEEVSAAYKVLAQIYHPDRYLDASLEVQRESEERMRALNHAYKEAQAGNLAVRPLLSAGNSGHHATHVRPNGSSWFPAGTRGQDTPGYAPPGVPWDVAVEARAAAAVKAEQDRQAREASKPQGHAIARPRPTNHGPVLKGLGMARFTGNVNCTGCGSVQWLPGNWRDRLDTTAFYCSRCGRLIFTR